MHPRQTPDAYRPLIGITAYRGPIVFGAWRKAAAFIPQEYVGFVVAGGGVPVVLPPDAGDAGRVVAAIDALILSGGPDVSPDRYGVTPDPKGEAPDPLRDAWEFDVLSAALERDQPVLAVCRGMQVLNVTYGGTLHQHVPDLFDTESHRVSVGRFNENSVSTVPGSRLSSIVGPALDVPCHHHQAVDRVGVGLVPVANAQDGLIEGLEDPSRSFVIGVQWHPEEGSDPRLARALAAAAISKNQTRSTAWT